MLATNKHSNLCSVLYICYGFATCFGPYLGLMMVQTGMETCS